MTKTDLVVIKCSSGSKISSALKHPQWWVTCCSSPTLSYPAFVCLLPSREIVIWSVVRCLDRLSVWCVVGNRPLPVLSVSLSSWKREKCFATNRGRFAQQAAPPPHRQSLICNNTATSDLVLVAKNGSVCFFFTSFCKPEPGSTQTTTPRVSIS